MLFKWHSITEEYVDSGGIYEGEQSVVGVIAACAEISAFVFLGFSDWVAHSYHAYPPA
jgi:hypothetical protein